MNLAQNPTARPSVPRGKGDKRTATTNRHARVRELLTEAMREASPSLGEPYWADLALSIEAVRHVHDLVTDHERRHVTAQIPELLGAFVLHEGRHTIAGHYREAIAATRRSMPRLVSAPNHQHADDNAAE